VNFEIEWLDAPGVRDRVLAATWARLRISVRDQDVTEVIHVASSTRRAAVYGTVFPLVEWMVENWWHLLNEPSPTSPLKPGRGAPLWKRGWVRRHNLLAAREGSALPDAAFVRDGEDIVVAWYPDDRWNGSQRVRFVGGGEVRVPVTEFTRAAIGLIEGTLQRLTEVVGTNEDVTRLLTTWHAIQSADRQEGELCRSLAILGVDPYDPDESGDLYVQQVRSLIDEFPTELREDLLEGIRPGDINSAAAWVRTSRLTLANESALHTHPTVPAQWDASAHQTGYRLARRVRDELLGVAPEVPLPELLELWVHRLGWNADPLQRGGEVASLEGLVGLSRDTAKPVLIDPYVRRQNRAERFLLARGAFFSVSASLGQGRLLTGAVTRPQRAARAFAAELLAPSSALAREISGVVSDDQVAELADIFGVSPLLIQHQIVNHHLGAVAA